MKGRNLCKYIGAVLLGIVGGLTLIAVLERFGYPKWLKWLKE